VKEKRSGKFLPSCVSLAGEGMDIDASGPEVVALRKSSLELLLSEHRAECEAPCHVVCPAGYNIPLMNRYLAGGNIDEAISLARSEQTGSELRCFTCAAYCENACRRKKIDNQISIKNLQIFVYNQFGTPPSSTEIKPIGSEEKRVRKFSSKTGKIEKTEQDEWLKETPGILNRFITIDNNEMARSESEACMHCDCRAKDDCRLRELSIDYNVKDPSGKVVNAPIAKKINRKTGLIFENAKCIKCGLCVRVCEDTVDEPALCFINRGFISIISEPLAYGFDDVLKTKAARVINICPTGALSDINE
jgi:ferredoxin